MSEISDKLKQLLGNRSLMTGAEFVHKRKIIEQRRAAGDFEIDKFVPGEVVENEAGRVYLVRHAFPLDARHGGVEIGSVLESIPEHIALTACDTDLEEFNPATACFIDTETTGLAGGTGTVAFLIGVGYFDGGAFRLEQAFMRDYDEEEAMLQYLNGIFARCQTVVSFNGKSFDVPLLRTRYISNRLPFRLDAAMHFDLIHAVRRIWKLRLKECSLNNVERAILGLERRGDVPSAEIPQIWFDYLRSRDAQPLKRVFYHHRMDVMSLVALTAFLSQRMDVPCGEGFEHAEDRLSLVRLHFRRKRYEDAVAHAHKLLEAETDDVVRHQCLELLAYACKRMQNWPRMAETWEQMVREFPSEILGRLELAKFYEHRMRNLPAAQKTCEEAIQYLETRAALEVADEFESLQIRAFQNRVDRLRRKLSKGALNHNDA